MLYGFYLLYFWLGISSASIVPPTGVPGYPQFRDFGDPSAPDFSQAGVVRVHTTGGDALVWKDSDEKSAIDQLLAGHPPRPRTFAVVP